MRTNLQQLETDIRDWAVWYNEHAHKDRGVKEEIEFLKRALDGAMSCMVLVCREFKTRDEAGRPESKLILKPEMFT